MKRIRKISEFSPKKGELVILDTCFLLRVFYTIGDYKREIVKRCNDLFTKIINTNAKILIFPELIEEFFNRFIKLEYDLYLEKSKKDRGDFSYKDFRETDEFQNAVNELKEIYKNQIEPYSISVISEISLDGLVSFLDYIAELDLKDMIMCSVARDKGAPIVTSDSDYLLSTFADDVVVYFVQ